MSSGGAGRDRADAPAVDDVAVGAGQRLARQQALDPLEDGVGAGGELKLQQFLDRRRPHCALDQAGFQQRLRFRREGQAVRDLRCIQRLDAERVAA